jgi:hypothetical protein
MLTSYAGGRYTTLYIPTVIKSLLPEDSHDLNENICIVEGAQRISESTTRFTRPLFLTVVTMALTNIKRLLV